MGKTARPAVGGNWRPCRWPCTGAPLRSPPAPAPPPASATPCTLHNETQVRTLMGHLGAIPIQTEMGTHQKCDEGMAMTCRCSIDAAFTWDSCMPRRSCMAADNELCHEPLWELQVAFGTCGRVHHACSAANPQHSLWHPWQHAAHGDEAVLILLNLPALTANPRQFFPPCT